MTKRENSTEILDVARMAKAGRAYLRAHKRCEVGGCERASVVIVRTGAGLRHAGIRAVCQQHSTCGGAGHLPGAPAAARTATSGPADDGGLRRAVIDSACGPDHMGRFRVPRRPV
jgi:hypothetical protein